jgi:hypothetical protein
MAFATFSAAVDASVEVLWEVLVEKVEHPERHTGNVDGVDVLEREGNTLVRRLRTAAGEVTERVTVDAEALRIDSEFLDHPQYTGTMVKKIVRPEAAGDPQGRPALTYTLDWEPKGPALQGQDLTPLVMAGVQHTAKAAAARAQG